MVPKSKTWTPEEKAGIIEDVNSGLRYLEIAKKWNTTKNSVAGVVARAKGKVEVKVIEVPPMKATREVKRRIFERKKGTSGLDPRSVNLNNLREGKQSRIRLQLIEERLTVTTITEHAVTIYELEKHHCRYPIGEPRSEEFRYCGKPVLGEAPYCRECCAVVYNPRH